MQLNLTSDETATLHEMVAGYLADLRMEIAHTDAREFRELLRGREALLERLLGALEQQGAPAH